MTTVMTVSPSRVVVELAFERLHQRRHDARYGLSLPGRCRRQAHLAWPDTQSGDMAQWVQRADGNAAGLSRGSEPSQ